MSHHDEADEVQFVPAPRPERVDHPAHYGGDQIYEHQKVVRAWGLNYHIGNATKYLCRAGKKDASTAGTILDYEKAIWYIQAEIDHLKSQR